jgi:hypothetical protein
MMIEKSFTVIHITLAKKNQNIFPFYFIYVKIQKALKLGVFITSINEVTLSHTKKCETYYHHHFFTTTMLDGSVGDK